MSDVLPIEGFFTPLASKDETAASTRLLGMQRGASGWGTALWVDLAQPSTLHPLYFVQARTDADLRWVNGTPFIISSTCALFPAELCLIDTGSGNSERISDGGGPFGAPYGWRAPEADAGLQALALVSDRELRLFRREPTGWVVIGSVRSPLADAGLANLGSPEPFVVGGRSYATLSVSAAADVTPGRTDQQIWVISLDPQRPLAVRCDDGLPGPRSRVDPEALVIGNRVFVYYYTISSASSQVSVCQLDLQ